MAKMTEKQADAWKRMSAKGMWPFIFKVGVLGWGLPVGAVWALAMAAMKGWNQLGTYLTFGMIGFPIGGLLFGAIMWRAGRKNYEKYLASEKDSGEQQA